MRQDITRTSIRVLRKSGRVAGAALRGAARGNRLTRGLWLRLNNSYSQARDSRQFRSRVSGLDPREHFDLPHLPQRSVIVIVVDSLRNSRLSSKGYRRNTTPFLDTLPARFSAIAPSSWTYPSVASILTGLYPHSHGAVLAGKSKDMRVLESFCSLKPSLLTLPEMLFILGYEVYFGTAIPLAEYAVRGRAPSRTYSPITDADVVLGDMARWIRKRRRGRFFAYAHLADLHIPLAPPEGYRHFLGNVKDLPNINTWAFARPEERRDDPARFREYRESRELLYDNALRYVDSAIERFCRKLGNMGLDRSTLVIVTADHGEEFWEHADMTESSFFHPRGVHGISHGHSPFQELIEVPLLMAGPVPPGEHSGFVSTVDIAPTVLDFLGIGHRLSFDGVSLFKAQGERPLLSEASSVGREKKAQVAGRYKLLYSKDDGVQWLFDLEKDPLEQRPITDERVTAAFVDRLNRMLRQDEARNVRRIAARRPPRR